MKHCVCSLLFMICFLCFANGQEDSLSVIGIEKSEEIAVKEVSKKEKRMLRAGNRQISPQKAVLLSLVLPGAGQVYNKRYWKLPLVYGALGTMGYFIAVNTRDLKTFRRAYLYRTDEDPNTVDEFEGIYTAGDLQSIRNAVHSNVELSYIGFFIAYALTGVDAFVDAHLHSFDISEDLSLQVGPELIPTQAQIPAMGIGLHLRPRVQPVHKPLSLF